MPSPESSSSHCRDQHGHNSTFERSAMSIPIASLMRVCLRCSSSRSSSQAITSTLQAKNGLIEKAAARGASRRELQRQKALASAAVARENGDGPHRCQFSQSHLRSGTATPWSDTGSMTSKGSMTKSSPRRSRPLRSRRIALSSSLKSFPMDGKTDCHAAATRPEGNPRLLRRLLSSFAAIREDHHISHAIRQSDPRKIAAQGAPHRHEKSLHGGKPVSMPSAMPSSFAPALQASPHHRREGQGSASGCRSAPSRIRHARGTFAVWQSRGQPRVADTRDHCGPEIAAVARNGQGWMKAEALRQCKADRPH